MSRRFYKLEDDIIRLDAINIVSKKDRIHSATKDGKDDWSYHKGEFLIVINDDREYSYKTIQDRDIVYRKMSKISAKSLA